MKFERSFVCVLFAVAISAVAADKLAPSENPPDGLKPSKAVQFVVFGFDDNMYSGLKGSGGEGGISFVQSYINSKRNSKGSGNKKTFDGTVAHATFYIKTNGVVENENEDVKYVREALNRAYKAGNEIGNHTYSHRHGVTIDWDSDPAKRTDNYTLSNWVSEMEKANEYLTKPYIKGNGDKKHGVGVDPKDIVGFRTPYLEYNHACFDAQEKVGFRYDCSIEEGWESDQSAHNIYWPYTLDYISPGDEAVAKGTFGLKEGIVGIHPGIWEFACPVVVVPPDSVCEKYGVKPGLRERLHNVKDYCEVSDGKITGLDWNLWFDFFVSKEEFVAIWKYNLDQHINGNRAPFTFGYHSDIYSDKYDKYDCDDLDGGETNAVVRANASQRRDALKTIVDYAVSQSCVRLVSAKELMEWMRNPESL